MTTDGRFFILFNIGSGRGDGAAARAAIAEVLTAAGRPYELVEVDDPAQLPRLAQETVERARAGNGIVVAAGGDGTINAVAQAVLPSGLRFGVLPQGTFNYFGRTHGIPQDTAEAVRALLGAHVEATQAGLVNERIFLVNASIGLYPRLLEDREAYKQRLGRSRLVALWSAVVTLLREHRRLTLLLTHEDGRSELLHAATLVVGNNQLQLAQLGLPEAEAVTRGQLAAVAVRPIGTAMMFWLLLRGALGRLADAEQLQRFGFTHLVVKPWLYGRRSIKVAMDGEVTWLRAPLVFRVAPQALQLLVPRELQAEARDLAARADTMPAQSAADTAGAR